MFLLGPRLSRYVLTRTLRIVFALAILAFVLELPESPRWLILKGEEDEALNVLAALSDVPVDDPFIHTEFIAIKDTVLEMMQGSFRDLFTNDENRHFHRTCLAYVNQVFQQISGINLITYYAATIYQNEIKLTPFISRILAACNGTEYFLASWIAVFIIEKTGRRKLMLFGAAGMVVSMVILAVMTHIGGSQAGIVAAAFLFIFNSFFAVGWLGMTWLYPAEIVPLRIRAPANALSTSANVRIRTITVLDAKLTNTWDLQWAFNFMVVMITPVCFSTIGYKTYIIFAVINAFIIPVVYFFYPETAYRSLEEMDIIFRKFLSKSRRCSQMSQESKDNAPQPLCFFPNPTYPYMCLRRTIEKCHSIFTIVKIAKEEPHRYGKNGKVLINYEETQDHLRRASYVSDKSGTGRAVENVQYANPDHRIETGFAGDKVE